MKKAKILLMCMFAAFLVIIQEGCGQSSFKYMEGMVWNTSYHITYYSPENRDDAILSAMAGIDSSLSAFNPASLVSVLNEQDSVRADGRLLAVLAKTKQVWEHSFHYFDPSAAPLINAYGFGAHEAQYPDSASVAEIMRYVGWDKVITRGDMVYKGNPRMEFNFSAIAKGYGCDLVADALMYSGVNRFMVEIGGEVVVRGLNPNGKKWHIAVDRPIATNTDEIHESQLVIAITDCAVATSGSYRNFRDRGGSRVSHIVDPTTGIPAATPVVSATIVAPDCMTADAYATACMAMPLDLALKMIESQNLTAFLIYADGNTFMTPSFKALIAD